ncbi:MAG TPA: hypothetical protein VFC51_02115 [Chloroflexota bacterium]|nr:hypothetical protein [Chloroflexota bacterium]
MVKQVFAGVAAGAVGTVALNVSTSIDMAWRGRPPSEVPAKVADKIAGKAGLRLVTDEEASHHEQRRSEKVKNRREGLGALMGYGVGLALGALYGSARAIVRDVPIPAAGILLGGAAMAASEVPATTLGATEPSEWGLAGWTADVVPHLIYGLSTALVYEALAA